MSNIKACIFDLDGTLTNTINAIAHFGNCLLYTSFEKIPDSTTYKARLEILLEICLATP